jgi:Mce-associated membrane protein
VVATRAYLLSRPLLAVSIGLVVIAAVCAGWFGWSWHESSASASTSPSASAPAAGSGAVYQALRQGEQDVQAFNTLSYHDLAGGLKRWQAASTGVLRQETTSGWPTFAKKVTAAKTVTTATILDAAITSLQKNTAGIIAAVQITVTPAKGSAATKRNRLAGTLSKTPSGWKLSSLTVVPVGSTPSTAP